MINPSEAAGPQPVQPDGEGRRALQQRRRRQSVVIYMFVLFLAAFVLLLLSLLMERRQNEENINDLNQTISGLRDSVSAMQSVEQLYQDKTDLQSRIEELEGQLAEAKEERLQVVAALGDQTLMREQLEQTVEAMDWFWQIDEAYVRGQYTLCRSLIECIREKELVIYLPQESVTDNDRFSPYDRYQEIYDKVF